MQMGSMRAREMTDALTPQPSGADMSETMHEFEYKGIKIEVWRHDGLFHAVINGENVEKPSLSAMKAAIDKDAKERDPFESFAAISVDRYSGGASYFTVTGIRKSRGYGDQKWLSGGATLDRVVRDTPENRKLIDAYLATKKEQYAIEKKYEAISNDAFARIPFVAPPKATSSQPEKRG